MRGSRYNSKNFRDSPYNTGYRHSGYQSERGNHRSMSDAGGYNRIRPNGRQMQQEYQAKPQVRQQPSMELENVTNILQNQQDEAINSFKDSNNSNRNNRYRSKSQSQQ